MIVKQKILILVGALMLFFIVLSNAARLTPEKINYQKYQEALANYNENDFSDAYYQFGKISKFSKLKQAAIYRQALCAEKLSDKKTELKKYKELIKKYPNTELALRSKYLKAQNYYFAKDFRKAENEFKKLQDSAKDSDYAAAAHYYLGSIEIEKALKTKNKRKIQKHKKNAITYFKKYIKEAPTGRFAANCADKWVSAGTKLNNEDNLLIAKIYLENSQNKKAEKFLQKTNISVSWPYLVQNAYATKNFKMVKYYTEAGLKGKGNDAILINEDIDEKTQNTNIYKAIDLYLETSKAKISSLSYLMSIGQGASGYDYLLYRNCKNLPPDSQTACYNSLYYKYPDGQFAAEALANIFYDKVRTGKYFMAKKLGKVHLNKFSTSNSAPMVMFWLAKTGERTKNYDEARSYYRTILRKYPDSYYAYHAFLNINRYRYYELTDIQSHPVEFPYKKSNYTLITELAKVKDYGLINQLCKDDEFIQSWLKYLQGDYASSSRIARDAMDKLEIKPDRADPRWRLVYPIHYYNEIKASAEALNNDPIIILSIIREESYFNPKAQSTVGARGLMQLMPTTAKETASAASIGFITNDLLFDPEINIRLGNRYYSRLKKALFDKDFLAILAYNGGIGSVSKWKDSLEYFDADDFVEMIPYAETQNYLKKVYRTYWNYLRVYSKVHF